MKSANITSLPGMGDMGVAPQRTVAKQDDGNKPVDFKMLMHRSIADGKQMAGTNRGNAASDLGAVKEQRPSSSFESPRQDNNFINKADTSSPVSGDMQKNVKETYAGMEDAVKETVAGELGISEDELEEAMEVLGLSYMDLFDPSNMMLLLGQLSQDMPGLSIPAETFDPAQLIGQMEDAAAAVLSEADLTPEETELLSNEFAAMEDPASANAFSDILTKAAAMTEQAAARDAQIGQINPELSNGFASANRMDRQSRPDVAVINVIDDEPEDSTAQTSVEDGIQTQQAAEEAAAPVVSENAKPAQTTESLTVQKITDPQTQTTTTTVTVEVTEDFSGEEAFSDTAQQNGGNSALFDNAANLPGANDILAAAHNAAVNVQQNFAEAVAAAQAPEAAMPYTSVDAADVIDQIVTNAQATITEEITRMEIELNPQTLGRMIMQVQSNSDGVVTAKLIAQNESVREALETQMTLLRENMNNRGIRVEAVEVSVGTHEFEQALEEGQQQAGQYEEQQREQQTAQGRRMRNLNASELDDMQGLLTEEEELTARIMREEGNTLNYQA